MTSTRRHAAPLLLLAAALLSGCVATDPSVGTIGASPAFGEATRSNMALQSGAVGALTSLGTRFARSVPSTITFAFNSAALDGPARAVLDRQADFMRQFPEVRFSVYGHTDLVGSAAYNRDLGRRRARAAVAYLATRGVSRSRLAALVSLGETRPVVRTEGQERANRRTMTRVSGFVAGNPLVLDGKYARIAYRSYVAGSGASISSGGSGGTGASGTGATAGTGG